MKKSLIAVVALTAVLVSAPAFAAGSFTAFSSATGGNGGPAGVFMTSTGTSQISANFGSVTGGDGGFGAALALSSGNATAKAFGGDGGLAEFSATAKDASKITTTFKSVNGGWAGDAFAGAGAGFDWSIF